MRRGNPNLKAAHETMEVTYEQIREMQRCMLDPIYFIKNYVYITHPTQGSIKFDLYDYQEDLVNNYHKERHNIVLSARQTGKTETSCAYMVWWTIFQENKTVLVVSKDSESAKEIIKRIQQIYEELPHWLKPGIQDDDWNKHVAAFDNRSRIVARTTTAGSGRGLSISLLYCDELAFVKPTMQEQFWTSVFPTLSCVSGDTLVLTNNGMSRISDTFSKNIEVGNLNKNTDDLSVYSHKGLQPVSHKYISPASKTLKVKTETGRELTVTPHHPLMKLVNIGGELTKTEELVVGDYLRVDIGMNIFGNKKVDKDEAYMLGGYIAEGWINSKNTIWISNTDNEFREVYLRNNFKEDLRSHHKIRMSSRNKIKEWMGLGIDPDKKCYNKIFPKEVLKFNKESMCHFLAGMFDGDGSVTERSISYTSTSHQLVRELQSVLDNLGIVSRIYLNDSKIIFERDKDRILPQGTKLKSLRDTWTLNIPLSQYYKFKQLIPLKISRKRKKIDKIIEARNQNDFKQFYVPIEPIELKIRSIIKDTGKSINWFREHGVRLDKVLDGKSNRKLTISKLQKFVELILKHELYIKKFNLNILLDCANPNIKWERIKAIEESYCEATYDFTVPVAATFLQNGIMGSNTGGKCIITSTPNGDTDLFSTMWRGAEANTNGFLANRIYWDQPPGRDESFKEKQIAALGERQWLQEYECLAGNVYINIKDAFGKITKLTIRELYKMLGPDNE